MLRIHTTYPAQCRPETRLEDTTIRLEETGMDAWKESNAHGDFTRLCQVL